MFFYSVSWGLCKQFRVKNCLCETKIRAPRETAILFYFEMTDKEFLHVPDSNTHNIKQIHELKSKSQIIFCFQAGKVLIVCLIRNGLLYQ